METLCKICSMNPWEAIKRFYGDDSAATDFLRAHGVLPAQVNCPKCSKPCSYNGKRHQWYCGNYIKQRKSSKRIRCNFYISDYNGTFLEGKHLPTWKVVLFVNHWLEKSWDHDVVSRCLNLSGRTSVEWRNYCSEVAEHWLDNQHPIGGPEKIVEIDLCCFGKKNNHIVGGDPSISVFGGIERGSRNIFIVPLMNSESENGEKDALLEVIKKHILPETTIISRCPSRYPSLDEHGFIHIKITSNNFVDPSNSEIHTQNVTRLWKDLKDWILRPGMRTHYFKHYLQRYMFTHSVDDRDVQLHQFFREAGKLFVPLHGRQFSKYLDAETEEIQNDG